MSLATYRANKDSQHTDWQKVANFLRPMIDDGAFANIVAKCAPLSQFGVLRMAKDMKETVMSNISPFPPSLARVKPTMAP
ncbi:MAG: hypothetical protein IPN19_15280 [Elusimicrobia bacterium]|nr:hypothetical protein [Elusimicrobiota bacterium]